MHRSSSVLIVVAVLFLAGCVPTPAAVTEPSSPTPTAVAAEITPGPRVPIDCADLVTAADLIDVVGEGVRTESQSGNDMLVETSTAQAGVLSCFWSTADLASSLSILVAPTDLVGDSFRPHVGSSATSPDCLGEATWTHCTLATLAGQYAVEVFVTVATGATDVAPKLAAVTTRLVAQLSAAPAPTAPWLAPETSELAYGDCAGIDPSGAVAAAFADVQMNQPEYVGSGDGPQLVSVAFDATGFNECSWSPVFTQGQPVVDAYVAITVLPGGAWNWDALRTGEPVDIAGVTEATWVCDGYGCTVTALVRHSIVRVSSQSQTRDPLADATTALAAFAPVAPLTQR